MSVKARKAYVTEGTAKVTKQGCIREHMMYDNLKITWLKRTYVQYKQA